MLFHSQLSVDADLEERHRLLQKEHLRLQQSIAQRPKGVFFFFFFGFACVFCLLDSHFHVGLFAYLFPISIIYI